jgi:hypothetical protein
LLRSQREPRAIRDWGPSLAPHCPRGNPLPQVSLYIIANSRLSARYARGSWRTARQPKTAPSGKPRGSDHGDSRTGRPGRLIRRGLAFVVQRTDPDTRTVEALQTMRLKTSPSGQSPRDASRTGGPVRVPLEVFYVVQTTGDIIGRRHHRVCPPLYETRHQARIELVHLRAAGLEGGTYSIWKAATYVEPAEWLYDVVTADGSVARPSDRQQRRIDRVAATG